MLLPSGALEESHMLKDAIRNLKLDRRLVNRRGWIDASELEAEIERLSDASDKAATGEDESPPESEQPS